MKPRTEHRSALSWWTFLLVITTLAMLAGLIVWNQYQHAKDNMLQVAQDRTAVLRTALLNALEDGRYDEVQPLFDEWGKRQPQTVQLKLTSHNGFVHGAYQRPRPTKHTLVLEQQMEYGYRGSATLLHVLDTSNVSAQLVRTTSIVSAALLIVVLFGAHLVSSNRKQFLRARELAQMSSALDRRNHQLGAEHALLQSVIDSIPDLIYFKSTDGVYEGANRAFCTFHGLEQDSLPGKTDSDLFKPEVAEAHSTRDEQVIDSRKALRQELRAINSRNVEFLMEGHYTPYFDNERKLLGMIATERDITQIHEYQENLRAMAYRDPLTGLANRRYLVDRMQKDLSEATRHGHKLAVCALDLDGFKPINDRYGHAVGDRVIIAFAARLQTMLREEDTIARWGGDEFTLLLGNLQSAANCVQLMERMIELINTPFILDEFKIQLTASVGITVFPDDHQDADTLLRHADQAMYQSKQLGKNTYTFFDTEQDRSLHQQASQLARFIDGLRQQELRVNYQPQINMLDGSLHGFEALVRWNHPERGLLPPGDFLPLIEGHPASVELDWWVIENVLEQLRAWKEQNLHPKIGVNLSPMTLQMSDFVSHLQTVLRRYPEAAGHLQMEILESSAMLDIGQISDTIEQCRSMGIDFALDDFGTGYSSLTYLRRLPAQTLKIDRSFVGDMLSDENDMKIVEGILRLAEAFDRVVIAEGVESIEHGSELVRLGCRYAQGYIVARPMGPEAITEWLAQYQSPEEWRLPTDAA